jgi:hypothetical protein
MVNTNLFISGLEFLPPHSCSCVLLLLHCSAFFSGVSFPTISLFFFVEGGFRGFFTATADKILASVASLKWEVEAPAATVRVEAQAFLYRKPNLDFLGSGVEGS